MAGWPALALYTEHYHINLHGERQDRHRSLVYGRDRWGAPKRLPIAPVPWGFALDTAFYGTLLLWSAPGFVRRAGRRSRGLCLACG